MKILKYRTCRDGVVHYGQSRGIDGLPKAVGLSCEGQARAHVLGVDAIAVYDESEVDCMTCLTKHVLLETWLYIHNQRSGGR